MNRLFKVICACGAEVECFDDQERTAFQGVIWTARCARCGRSWTVEDSNSPSLIGAGIAASLNQEHGPDWPLQLAVDALRRENLRDVGYATGLAAAVAHRGHPDSDEDEEDEGEPEAVRLEEVLYLTNATGENAHGNPATLDQLGLPYGWWNKGWTTKEDPAAEFYPLTEAESAVVQAEEVVPTSQGPFLGNYTVLVRGRKFHLPTLEVNFATEDDPEPPGRDMALHEVREKAGLVREAVMVAGGFVLIEEDAGLDDRHCLYVGIPFKFAMALGHDAYKAWMNTILGAQLGSPILPPVEATVAEGDDRSVQGGGT